MLGNRSWDDWIAQYSTSHRHPVNRFCHTIGIPMIALGLPLFLVAASWHAFWPVPTALFVASFFVHRLWPIAAALFIIGWLFQFIGHAFEGKPPEFFSDWRFLLVGTRWWARKIQGKT